MLREICKSSVVVILSKLTGYVAGRESPCIGLTLSLASNKQKWLCIVNPGTSEKENFLRLQINHNLDVFILLLFLCSFVLIENNPEKFRIIHLSTCSQKYTPVYHGLLMEK